MVPTLIFHFGSSSAARASVAPSRADGEKTDHSMFLKNEAQGVLPCFDAL